MNDTPRTDALATTHVDGEWHVSTPQVPADFARELERENAKLRKALTRIAWTTMSHVLSYEGGFTRCRTIAAEALANNKVTQMTEPHGVSTPPKDNRSSCV